MQLPSLHDAGGDNGMSVAMSMLAGKVISSSEQQLQDLPAPGLAVCIQAKGACSAILNMLLIFSLNLSEKV